jgi:hypothetical protein
MTPDRAARAVSYGLRYFNAGKEVRLIQISEPLGFG